MSLRKSLKNLGRKAAKTLNKVNRVAAPVTAGVVSFVATPVAGAAVAAIGGEAGRYFRATQARNEGDYANARALGRKERIRTDLYGAVGVGAGAISSAVYSGSAAGLLGQGGQSWVGLAPTTPTAEQLASFAPTQVKVPGMGVQTLPLAQAKAVSDATGGTLLSSQALAPAVAGMAGPTAAEIAAATQSLFKSYTIPGSGTGKHGEIPTNHPPGDGQGGGGSTGGADNSGPVGTINAGRNQDGGMSGGAIAAIAALAFLFLS